MFSKVTRLFSRLPTASPQTKFFIMNWAFYFIIMLVTTWWCYARIEYVHSFRQQQQEYKENNP